MVGSATLFEEVEDAKEVESEEEVVVVSRSAIVELDAGRIREAVSSCSVVVGSGTSEDVMSTTGTVDFGTSTDGDAEFSTEVGVDSIDVVDVVDEDSVEVVEEGLGIVGSGF